MPRHRLLERYRDLLPITPHTPLACLGEGDTPLVRARHLEKEVGCRELYFKLEGCNPTGSFKDRGMVMAVAKALEAGTKAIICASTGNTSASAAAYGAHYGLKTVIVVPGSNIARGKLAQALVFGAQVISIEGNFDHALELVRGLVKRHPVTIVNSVNPHRIQGQMTASYEIVDELGEAPDYLCIPVGNAGNITAYWRGFKEYLKRGKATTAPRMMGFQAEGAAPIVTGQIVEAPQTIASAIRIGNPASWQGALAARDESEGDIQAVSDEQILEAYRLLGAKEGVFGEPASAASVAGLLKLARGGLDLSGKRVVCVITGSGLKDPDVALSGGGDLTNCAPQVAAIEHALGWS